MFVTPSHKHPQPPPQTQSLMLTIRSGNVYISTVNRCVSGLAVLVAMFIYVASTSDRLGPYSTTSSYRYGRGFAAIVASFLSANVAAVTAAYASTRRQRCRDSTPAHSQNV